MSVASVGEIHPSAIDKAIPVVRIRPSHGWAAINIKELWQHRELIYFLIWRNYKLRYKQTALGALWAIIQPVSTMIVFSLVFGKMAKLPSDGIPYPILTYSALVPWGFFATGLAGSSNSLVGNATILTKVYFPRLVIPITGVLTGLIDFVLAFLVLLVMMAFYHITPTVNVVFLPLFLLLTIATSLGVGLWFSAVNVRFRDVGYIIPFLTTIWMYATPVAYASSLVHGRWHVLFGLNPMAGVCDGFRWALLRDGTAPGFMFVISAIVAVVILVSGAYYFKSVEKTFADIV